MSSCSGIAPNPDIAGIGVRVAIYVQALLSIIYPIFFAADGAISVKEFRTLSRISINITLTACALLISTGIQAATFGLSLYHALIILQLSWINSMTFMTVHFVARAAQSVEAQRSTAPGERWLAKMNLPKLLRSREALVASVHFIAVGGVGIWIWNKIYAFGNQPECNPLTFLVILGKSVSVTHGVVIRRVSLALYGISVIPLGNVYIVGGILGVVAAIGRGLLCFLVIIPATACGRSIFIRVFPTFGPSAADRARTDEELEADIVQSTTFSRLTFYFAISGMATTMIILIANTEQMIHRSAAFVLPGEGDWTFGQTLALLLLFLPIWEAVGTIFGIGE
ncbi:hypothetical protein C8R46DRAFT_1056723 [Mycena filopes]|nr:hypothetical protein C8R46DRAFT_1056723 [Mycena filopes]